MARKEEVPLVPVVDMSCSEETAAKIVKEACTTVGFFYVSNHSVPQGLVEDFFHQCHCLFGLPLHEKMKMLQDVNNRGYTPLAEETLDPGHQTRPDTKEGFYFGREVAADSPEAKKPLHGPNQWPDEKLVPGFRAAATAYYNSLMDLAMRLLQLFALALELPVDFFNDKFVQPIVSLRPLHYTEEISQPEDGIFGTGAHSDYGMMTILAVDDIPGLQIHMNEQWIDVDPKDGMFIINIGDMLERWTNGMFKSTLHRVVNSSGRERYSIPLFVEPNFDCVVDVLPQCLNGQAPKYSATTAGQYLLDKYAMTHAGYKGPKEASESKAAYVP